MDYKNFYMNDIFNKKLNPDAPNIFIKFIYKMYSFLKMIAFPLQVLLIIFAITIGISLSIYVIRHVCKKLNSKFQFFLIFEF